MLYHGTNKVFTTPDKDVGRDGMDFGKGFYLTPNLETARLSVSVPYRRGADVSPLRGNRVVSDEAIVRQLTRSALAHLVERVMNVQSLALPEALREVYASALFAKIKDPETGLYREGPVFLYDMLCEERGVKQV